MSNSQNAASPADQPADALSTKPLSLRIGRYRLEQMLGSGGMGHVYLASDSQLHRRVAIKVLAGKLARGDPQQRLALGEARAVARLNHPNIASVHDILEHDGKAYIVMELLEGETLATRLSRGALPLAETVRAGLQMASGLSHAHSHSLIHCDFKPANVFLTNDGTVKILDFGLARLLDASTTDESAGIGASPTLIQQRAGTPGYMSPEHLSGAALDARTDVFALGVVVHEMATGRRPTSIDGVGLDVNPSLPEPLRSVVTKALALRPSGRFQTAAEMEGAMRAVIGAVTTPTRRWHMRASYAVVAAILAMAVAGWTAWAGLSRVDDSMAVSAVRPIVAVLPFSWDERDKESRYLAAGLAEIVTNDLASSPRMVVVSNSSARSAVKENASPASAAAFLGASHVISGAVRAEGTLLRVDLRLFQRASNRSQPLGSVTTSYADAVGRRGTLVTAVSARLREAGLPVDASTDASARSSAPLDARALEEYAQGREYLERADAGRNLEIAGKLFESAIARDPTFALAHAAAAEAAWRTYRRTRDATWADRAQAAAFEAMRLAPQEGQVRYIAALVLHGTGRSREALDELSRAIAMQPTNDEAHRLLGRLHAEAGDIDKAIASFNTAIQLRPGSSDTYHALGVACFGSGRYQEAIKALTRATELRPDSAVSLQALGTAYHASGDEIRALQNYERANAIAPNALSYSNVGMIHHVAGRFREAVAAFEASIKLAPTRPITHRNLGDSLVRTGDRAAGRTSYRRAIDLAGKELQVNPKNARLLALQGVCFAKLGEHRRAADVLASALALTPTDIEVLYRSSVVSALAGDTENALASLQGAIDGGFSWKVVEEDEDLASLRTHPAFMDLRKHKTVAAHEP